jgi:hypothetical protein
MCYTLTMAVAVASPYEDLRELEQWLGQRPLARVLGKSQRLVWSWINEGRRLQPKSARLIRDAAKVVRVLTAARQFKPGELEYVLETPWPTLGAAPAELIQNGNAEMVIAALDAGGTVDEPLDGAKEEMMSKRTGTAALRLAQAAAERPSPLSPQLARFEAYDADEQFARGRIGNVRETGKRPAARGHVRGISSDEPINW